MSEPITLFWHGKDLRTIDSIGLAAACRAHDRVIGLFCLDPQLLARADIAPVRVAYLLGCLKSLDRDYHSAGSRLLLIHQAPESAIPELAGALGVTDVYWHLDVEPYIRTRSDAVATALTALGINIHTDWDRVLHPPETIKTGMGNSYTVFTPYWKNWSQQAKPAPAQVELKPVKFTDAELATIDRLTLKQIPSLKELGESWNEQEPLIFTPGTDGAKSQLDKFLDRSIFEYQEQRNYPAIDGTSGLSAALKFGTIGIREVWQSTLAAASLAGSVEAQAGIHTWQQELAWREFYQQALHHFPELSTGAYRDKFKRFPWKNNPEQFAAWCRGETGYPIVDAAMRQLNRTGWMHNRARMIVASFLTKDLIIDWRWGEQYFMQTLIDGDLAANNGGWQWSASSGMDPKPLRIFNPYTQAQKFDRDADYIRKWVPELERVETKALLTGDIPPLVCHQLNYPQPIVEHNTQQKLFKQLYAGVSG
jgi:deoxyribodipyrimidine photo-lyase